MLCLQPLDGSLCKILVRLLPTSLDMEIEPLIRTLITATTLPLQLPITIRDRQVENSPIYKPSNAMLQVPDGFLCR